MLNIKINLGKKQDTVVLWSKSSTLDQEIRSSNLGRGKFFPIQTQNFHTFLPKRGRLCEKKKKIKIYQAN